MGKNILFITYIYPNFGGVETVITQLSEYFITHGYTVHVVAQLCGPDTARTGLNAQLNTYLLPNSEDMNADENMDFIEKFIDSKSIDIIINQSYISKIARRLNLRQDPPLLFNVLHCSPMFEKYFICEYVTWSNIKEQKTIAKKIHKFQKYILNHVIPWRKYPGFKRWYRYHYTTCDRFLVLCDQYIEPMRKICRLSDQGKIRSLSNPIESLNVELNFNKKKQVLYIGRLQHAQKRVDRLLRAWAKIEKRFPEWELLIVGEGQERESLMELAKRLNICNVRFDPFTSQPHKYYDDASILCQTSQFEGQSMVLMEAQQRGCVPVAFASSGGTQSIITHNKSGILVQPFKIGKFARELSRLMSSPDLLATLRLGAIEDAKKYDPQVIGPQWDALFEEALQARKTK